jgi:hypothetical protein
MAQIEPTQKDTAQRTIRRVAINGMVDNLGNFRLIDFLKEQVLFLTILTILFSTLFISYQTKNYNDYITLFLNTSDFIQEITLYFYTLFFAWSFETIKHFLEVITIQEIEPLKLELLQFLEVITIEKPEHKLVIEVYYLIYSIILFFIFLNTLNILQAKRQNQIRNWKIMNYYTPKLFLVFEMIGELETNENIYLKKIKLLQRETTFTTEIKQLILRDYFKIDNQDIKKYNLIEEIRTFFFFYSIHKLKIIKEQGKEEKNEDSETKPKRTRQPRKTTGI